MFQSVTHCTTQCTVCNFGNHLSLKSDLNIFDIIFTVRSIIYNLEVSSEIYKQIKGSLSQTALSPQSLWYFMVPWVLLLVLWAEDYGFFSLFCALLTTDGTSRERSESERKIAWVFTTHTPGTIALPIRKKCSLLHNYRLLEFPMTPMPWEWLVAKTKLNWKKKRKKMKDFLHSFSVLGDLLPLPYSHSKTTGLFGVTTHFWLSSQAKSSHENIGRKK